MMDGLALIIALVALALSVWNFLHNELARKKLREKAAHLDEQVDKYFKEKTDDE